MFAAKIREWLKTLRKKNVAVLFATQSLSDVARSPIANAILESCPTRIFLPNPSALEENIRSLYASFGLNEKQITLLQSAVPKRDYYLQSPAGNRMFQLGLGPVGLAMCGAGSPNAQSTMSRIIDEHGSKYFAERYLQAVGCVSGTDNHDIGVQPQCK